MYIGDGTTRMRERDIFFDAELGLECQLRLRDAGAWICEPVTPGAIAERVYTDDQCTQPVYVTWRHEVGNAIWPCLEYKPYTYAFDFENSAARLIGDPYPDPVYWISPFDSVCRLMDVSNATAYALGPPITTVLPRASKRFE